MSRAVTIMVATAILAAGVLAASVSKSRATDVTLYKTPFCGCCEGYADYLRGHGFAVTVKPTHDLSAMSREAGIAEEFQGCHLSFVDGYAVSGHVPVDTVRRLLRERPEIKGVTLPAMPQGSPGMSGVKMAPFTIYEINDGAPRIYAVE